MANDTVTTVALYGGIDRISGWKMWLATATSLFHELGHSITHVDARCESFQSGKVLSYPRVKKKLDLSLGRNEPMDWLAFYALPADFSCASADYQLTMDRNHVYRYVSVTALAAEQPIERWMSVAETLKRHIDFERGEVFAMKQTENLVGYLSRSEGARGFPSLKVLTSF
jgi:hypothetical protein